MWARCLATARTVAAAAATTTLLFGGVGIGGGGAAAASVAIAPSTSERITIEGHWRTIGAGETQLVEEVRCPESHPFVFNEMYGGPPWRLTPGVEVTIGAGGPGELAVDIRAVLTRLEDKTAVGLGPYGLNRVTLTSEGEGGGSGDGAVSYRVDVHCTSDVNDSYA
ncbi:hypothetical protein [Agromyces silvae]|uniref:hypothetical protein n=1 Tax=Agromyces silvae TaxID=3388266 RepID=UPI00280B2E63|nr:hypothetical protein [Agromyces protaetiae]